MTALLLTIQFVVTIAMIGTILLQRSEGGALGLGGGGGVSSLMSGRGAANALSRSTVILAAIFITTSLALAMMAKSNSRGTSVIAPGQSGPVVPGQIPVLPGAPSTPSGAGPTAPGSTPSTSPLVPAVPVPSGPAAPPASTPAAPPASSTAPAPTTPAPAPGGGD
jgi:preprotein translocase subunit SecG